jgi:hypothetical protein
MIVSWAQGGAGQIIERSLMSDDEVRDDVCRLEDDYKVMVMQTIDISD